MLTNSNLILTLNSKITFFITCNLRLINISAAPLVFTGQFSSTVLVNQDRTVLLSVFTVKSMKPICKDRLTPRATASSSATLMCICISFFLRSQVASSITSLLLVITHPSAIDDASVHTIIWPFLGMAQIPLTGSSTVTRYIKSRTK